MATTVQILTTNYSGQTATITFSPCSGGTINLGSQVLPYNYISDNYLGDYSLYFADFNQTCAFSIPCPTPTPTTTPTETTTPTPTPTPTETTTPTPTETPTPTPTTTTTLTATPTPTTTPTGTPTPTPTSIYNIRLINNTTTPFTSILGFTDNSGDIVLSNQQGSFPLLSGQTLLGNITTATDGPPTVLVSGVTGTRLFTSVVNGVTVFSVRFPVPVALQATSGSQPISPTDTLRFTVSN